MDVQEFLAKKAEFTKQIQEHGKEMLVTLFKELFDTGKVEKVVWTQYTPYFNDGDACVFRVNDPGIYPKDYDYDEDLAYSEDWKYGNTWYFKAGKKLYDSVLSPKVEEFNNVFWKLEDVLEMVFGDHATVEAKLDADGSIIFDVEECYHD